MRKLYIKQQVFSMRGRFSVKDANEQEVYFIEGSFMKIPKTFSVKNNQLDKVAMITKKIVSFLPTFYVDVEGQEMMTIKKQFSFFKARYTIDAVGIEVRGNWWDMDFDVYQNQSLVGSVRKKWFTWGDSYELEIADDEMEALLVSLVIAIDCAKADQNTAGSAI